MGKARTSGGKLRAKRGRPRKDGDREPNGRIERKEADMEAVAVGRAQRVKLGIPETAALDPRLGFELGRLRVVQCITERQYEAGVRYAGDMARYYRLTGIPFPSSRAQDLASNRGSSGDDTESRATAARKASTRMADLREHLLRTDDIATGRNVHRVVTEVAVLDYGCMTHHQRWLRRGLNRLAAFYQLPEA